MWRPVALSAFLALLFLTSRSGQHPIATDADESGKADLGAPSADRGAAPSPIEIDLTRSSSHPKSRVAAPEDNDPRKPSWPLRQPDADDGAGQQMRVAGLSRYGAQTIPLPAPKTGEDTAEISVIVTQGEEKTALTSGEEEALSLMPPGPDFAAKVQRELIRLGCYSGRVDNIWGPMSRNAVARFNRTANAKLPLKQPTRALLSSARKAPDGYCVSGVVAGDGEARVAALEPDAEALKNRPAYLPPWMRGEPMPGPDENRVAAPPELAAQPDTGTAAREQARTTPAAASRAGRQVRRARGKRRKHRRRARSFSSVMDGRGAFWPGQ